MKDYTYQTLYAKAKSGKLRQWTVSCSDGVVTMAYGDVGGTITEQSYRALPTNVGRSNERDAASQAQFEAEAAHAHKLARKYAMTPEEASEPLKHLPMLAKPYGKLTKAGEYKITGDGKKFQWPAYAQPKYDGFRCLARWEGDDIVMTSRQGKEFDLPHIRHRLRALMPHGVTFDGELYLHGAPLQKIASLAKKLRQESSTLQYMVYDCVLPDADARYEERKRVISEALNAGLAAGPVRLCPTVPVDDIEAAQQMQMEWMAAGYEGAIIRDERLVYRYAYRSGHLLKLKTFEDAEFEIVAVNEGKGSLGVLQCTTEDFKLFGVTCGSHEERTRQLECPEQYIGQRLTVRYAFMTKDGVPFHPVGVAVRQEWD